MAKTILPGHRIELATPELPDGAHVEVIVLLQEKSAASHVSMLDLQESLPAGPRAFSTWDEYEQHLQEEKDAWER